MRKEIQEQLLAQNQQFYDTYAQSFSSTRNRVQPGVKRLLPMLLAGNSVLDLGCGNGNLATELAAQGYQGAYVGLDNSPALFEHELETPLPGGHGNAVFRQADFSMPDWLVSLEGQQFERVVSFAVLHHLPGEDLQADFFRSTAQALAPEGMLAISTWQVLNSDRLKARVQPWSAIGISEDEVGPGDLLMDWRAEKQEATPVLRYVHHFNDEELICLGKAAGLSLVETYFSDGKEGNLALYQVWQKPVN